MASFPPHGQRAQVPKLQQTGQPTLCYTAAVVKVRRDRRLPQVYDSESPRVAPGNQPPRLPARLRHQPGSLKAIARTLALKNRRAILQIAAAKVQRELEIKEERAKRKAQALAKMAAKAAQDEVKAAEEVVAEEKALLEAEADARHNSKIEPSRPLDG